uniref:Uncharacterized protein n=1 Tax=Acrobeloides nanus TaxID=290746 RepID=A0A914DQ11_9BILA
FLEDRGIKVSSDEGIPIDAWNLKRHFGNRVAENEFEKEALKRTKVNEMNSWENLPSTLTFLVAWLDTTDDFHRSTRNGARKVSKFFHTFQASIVRR